MNIVTCLRGRVPGRTAHTATRLVSDRFVLLHVVLGTQIVGLKCADTR